MGATGREGTVPGITEQVGTRAYRKSSHSGERVATEIRRAIRYGELLAGEHVRQEVWGDRVGVSGGPTREALKMLVGEGLLFYDAHRGYFVTRMDAADLVQYFQLREMLETAILESIRWPTPAEIDALSRLMDETLAQVKEGDVHAAADRSQDVMFTIFDLSPLSIIVREAKRYWNMTMTYRMMLISTVEDREHNNLSCYYEKVIDHLRRQDRVGLVALNRVEREEIPTRFKLY
jgi:DNA-binding GntR family transcriptional regulator